MADGTCSTCGEDGSKVMIWKSGNPVKCFTCTDPNCKRCGIFNEAICLECNTGYYIQYSTRHTAGNDRCVLCNTEATQLKVGLYCLSSDDCTANCLKCLNLYECGVCRLGYYLTCSNTCEACPTECDECTETECTKCKSNFFIMEGSCVGCDCDGTTSQGGKTINICFFYEV